MCLRLAAGPRLVAGSTPSLVCSRRSSQTGRSRAKCKVSEQTQTPPEAMPRSGAFAIIAIVGLTAMQTAMSANATIPSVTNFWPEMEKNLTGIKWKHAVNNKALLQEALQSDVHMIEADVGLDATTKQPIMVHPPATTSDLTLLEFVSMVMHNSKKGMKLDFKSFGAFNSSIPILTNSTIKVPVWLNADILKGPEGAEPVDTVDFLTQASKILPGSTLSLGWTTKNGTLNATDATYTKNTIDEMLEVVNSKVNKTRSVTYAMRAGLLAQSKMEDVEALMKNSESTTITVWSSKNDTVDATKLSEMIKSIGLNKVFVDVPAELEAQLQLNGSGNLRTGSLGVLSSILFCFLATRALSK